jgi:hypothetical protein
MKQNTADSYDAKANVARCLAEIAAAELLLRTGHPDVDGLCQAIADWSAELRLIEAGRG